jgi:predicted RNase H-like nuclease (RuvC/YqgF family)
MGMLQETLMKLRKEMGEKNKTIEELSDKISQLEKLVGNTGAVYMKGSNISKNL